MTLAAFQKVSVNRSTHHPVTVLPAHAHMVASREAARKMLVGLSASNSSRSH